MPRLTVNGHTFDAAPGTTLLHAAREAGASVPTLCHKDGSPHNAACMVCVVAVEGEGRFLPACAAPVMEGMNVRTEGTDLDTTRRMAVELLLGDHVGDCEAPCRRACPGGLDIPAFLRMIQHDHEADATTMMRRQLVLPRTLGHLCPAPCEQACRRAPHDSAVAIRALHATLPAAANASTLSSPRPTTAAKSVAIIGAGATGLAAAVSLQHHGHACTLIDAHDSPGGRLRAIVEEGTLPRAALDADLDDLRVSDMHMELGTRVDRVLLDHLLARHDAVILAGGSAAGSSFEVDRTAHGVRVDRITMETSRPGLFAAGQIVRGVDRPLAVAVGDGHHVAEAVHRHLSGSPPPPKTIHVQMGTLSEAERAAFLRRADPASTYLGGDGTLAEPDRAREAARCMHCECRAKDACRLRDVASQLGASTHAFRKDRRPYDVDDTHPSIVFEPGKCIACGLCIQVARERGEARGHTWIGRGFSVRVGAPLDGNVGEALREAGALCVEACPTGALAFRRDDGCTPAKDGTGA